MDKWLKRFALLSTILMFLVMIAGSLVTKTGSAMGCGNDWPLCNGKFIPEYTLESLVEYGHRFVTGMAGLVVFAFAIWAWLRYKGNREVRALVMFSLFFLILESLLGASAVKWPQSSPVLALHFGFSLLAFSGVLLLTIFVLQKDKFDSLVKQPISSNFRRFVWGVTIYAYGVVYLGAYVRHSGASMGCPDWPLCQGKLIPELSGHSGVQFAHRLGAAILFLLVLAIFLYAKRHFQKMRQDVYKGSLLAFVLICVQILSGGYVIKSQLSLFATIFHSAVITCLFGVLTYLCVQSLKTPQSVKLQK